MIQVTVVVPTYNRSGLLMDAVRSVLMQDLQQVEVIVVDDGSATPVCSKVQSLDTRVRCVRQRNLGESAARNRGIAMASGKYIAFLDDDDLLLPSTLTHRVAVLEDRPGIDVLLSRCSLMSYDGKPLQRPPTGPIELPKWPLRSLFTDNYVQLGGALIRRSSLKDSMWFDEDIRYAEDWLFWLRLMSAGLAFDVDPTVVAAYRMKERGYFDHRRAVEEKLEQHLIVLDRAWAGLPHWLRRDDALLAQAQARRCAMVGIEACAVGSSELFVNDCLSRAVGLDPVFWTERKYIAPIVADFGVRCYESADGVDPRWLVHTVLEVLVGTWNLRGAMRETLIIMWYGVAVIESCRGRRLRTARAVLAGLRQLPDWERFCHMSALLLRTVLGGSALRDHLEAP